MRRVSVDIGGTFTDCFVAWDDRYVESKALTTHQNLALGFNEALKNACSELALTERELLSQVDSVRYATTLGTNALIQRKGPRLGLLTTAGFRASVPLARAKGYGVGLDHKRQMDVPNAQRPDPIVPLPMILEVRERVDFDGDVILKLDEEHLRSQLRQLVDKGAEALVVVLANSVVNPVHELRIREVFLKEYPGHMLGSIPMLLSHQVAGRKGEYVRAMSTIMDGFLHQVMYHGLGTLELNLRNAGYDKPMLVNHNSGGMAQLNSTDALQTVHSGPVSGIAASEHLALQTARDTAPRSVGAGASRTAPAHGRDASLPASPAPTSLRSGTVSGPARDTAPRSVGAGASRTAPAHGRDASLPAPPAPTSLRSGTVSGPGLGNIVATDMGGTSFDIGIVVEGGVKHYDFNPVIERWMVSVPMVHLVTLGAGGGSICSYDRMFKTVRVGPDSAGSDPGPACYDRGGLKPTVTDADLLLGYLDPGNYAGGRIRLNPRRARQAVEEQLCDELDLPVVEACKLMRRTVDANMANGIATELRTRGYEPEAFTILAYGGNGPLHACGIARALGVKTILAPPFASTFSAVGAGNMNQLHIHEMNTWTVLFDANQKRFFTDYERFNRTVEELERRGRDDLLRQGFKAAEIGYRLELDMRYGNQRVQTAVVSDLDRIRSPQDVLRLIDQFHTRYGERFGKGSQAPEAGIRVNTVRVCSFVTQPGIAFKGIRPDGRLLPPPAPAGRRDCHFVGHDGALATAVYGEDALTPGTAIQGPAIVVTRATTYLVEPGWRFQAAEQNAVWFTRADQ